MANFSRLRLQGFKSFVEKTDLNIGPGLTGIVGPNGCGKSNLVEALTWVMGESSAKRLRGADMDDVIFNGTNRRPARNSAEVSVIIDNNDRTAPALFNHVDEIEVVRRIERGSGSSYYVNSRPVRARDAQMLFADLNIGAQSAAIVSQGRIAAIINAKPSERRQVLEESAGISGLYVRRHEAELKLKATDQNLARLQDILAGLEIQIDSLKRQARQASRYKNISADIKEFEIKLVLLEWMTARDNQAQAESQLLNSETRTAAMMADVASHNRLHAELSEAMPPLREKQAETAAAWQAQNFELRRLDDEEKQITQQIKEAQESLEHLDQDRNHEQHTITECERSLEKLSIELESIRIPENIVGETDRLKLQCEKHAQESQRHQENYQLALENSANLRAARTALQNRCTQVNSQISAVKNRIDQLTDQVKRKKSQQDQDHPIDDLRAMISQIEKSLEDDRVQQAQLRTDFDSYQIKLDNARQSRQISQDAYTRLSSEVAALENVLRADTPNGFRPVLEDIKAEEGFELALSKALGDSIMASIDTKSPSHWSGQIGNLNKENYLENIRSFQFAAPVIPLSSHIEAPNALNLALSFIGYVDDDAAGMAAASSLKPGQSLVSRQGTYWRWDGYCVLSTAMDRNAIRLKNKNRLDELRHEEPILKATFENAEITLKSIQVDLQSAKQSLQSYESKVRQQEQSLVQKRNELHRLIEQRAHTQQEIAKLEEGLSLAQSEYQKLKTQIQDLENELAQFDDNALDQHVLEVEQRKLAYSASQAAVSEARSALDSFQSDVKRAQNRMLFITEERKNLELRAQRSREHLSQLNERSGGIKEKLNTIISRPDTITERRFALLDNLKTMENAKSQAADLLVEAERKLSITTQNLKSSEHNLMDLREQRAKNQAILESIRASLEMIHQSIHDQFSMSADELWTDSQMTQEILLAEPIDKLRNKRDRLIRERDGMGAVNLRADLEMAEVEQNIQKLIRDRADLLDALQELRGAIQKLNREARERLQEAFNTINAHFQVLFSRLFGGGSAHLAFIESDDPLDAALEIYASPPGKSLQSLSLLSGGEKTLASTALIFAMFLTNPAPICVLDEIDAPLDDANVDRVCTMLEEIVQKCRTRFIIITHHRLTMARMDRLYGVTMSERGVSQLVSVDLQQKFDFLEAA